MSSPIDARAKAWFGSMPTLRSWAPRLASLKISVVCLLLLLILTAWGTIYQAEAGLYAAQTRFFFSWYFLVGGFLPLPGAQLVMWVLFFNLIASMVFRVTYSFANIGNILTHSGFLFLLAGSFVTFKFAQESYLPLAEKEVSNVSLDRRAWELAVWSDGEGGLERKVSAVQLGTGQVGEEIDFSEFGFKAILENYYRNCDPTADTTGMSGPAEMRKLGNLVTRRPAQDPEDNIAGARLRIKPAGGDAQELLLYGGQLEPLTVDVQGHLIQVTLRKQRHPLPVSIRLIDVKKEEYPGTGIARTYQSDVEVKAEGAMSFKTRINMNHPLHYKDFTFYQSSYDVDAQGHESSVFAVVENSGKLLPYISGAMIFCGMLFHFLVMLFRYGNHAGKSANVKSPGEVVK